EDQVRAVIGQAPALARIAHRAFALGGKVVDEDLMILPGELIDLVIEDGEALAEHGRAQIRERAHLTRERDRVDASRAVDAPGALIELAVAHLETLREAKLAADDLAAGLEAQRYGFAAGLRIERIGPAPEQEDGARHCRRQHHGAHDQRCATREHAYSPSLV